MARLGRDFRLFRSFVESRMVMTGPFTDNDVLVLKETCILLLSSADWIPMCRTSRVPMFTVSEKVRISSPEFISRSKNLSSGSVVSGVNWLTSYTLAESVYGFLLVSRITPACRDR